MINKQKIIELREARGWKTQSAMADFFGVNQSTIARLEAQGTDGTGSLGAAVKREMLAEKIIQPEATK